MTTVGSSLVYDYRDNRIKAYKIPYPRRVTFCPAFLSKAILPAIEAFLAMFMLLKVIPGRTFRCTEKKLPKVC